ncbi:dynein heavy chain, partial [Kipferlia bialata]
VKKIVPRVLQVILDLHLKVQSTFLPTAIKFHYQFNLRDLSSVTAGLLRAKPKEISSGLLFIRLMVHEANRVYRDRLISETDMTIYDKLAKEHVTKHLGEVGDVGEMLKTPILFSNFALGIGDGRYAPIPSYAKLQPLLKEGLENHNDVNAVMNLVLFEDAMEHVCRISRIISEGNALLVGVGGSGKQSLARLGAFIAGYEVFQITISGSYNVENFKADWMELYTKAGIKEIKTILLFTDQQIVNEGFLVVLNDYLSSGDITGLFPPDEVENIINGVRNEVKQAGIMDTKENCWNFFIGKVRNNLRVVMGFSPVGDALRVRARKFPALVTCTTIDWFHAWPHEALVSVAKRFLSDLDLGGEETLESVARYMADAHRTVNEVSQRYAVVERRHNYTTPKSFLELISLYKKLLKDKRATIGGQIERLEQGNVKLETTESDVALLQEELKKQQRIVEERKKAADELLVEVGRDQAIVEERRAVANVEAQKCAVIEKDVMAQNAEAQEALNEAEPIVQAALDALNTLNKSNLVELKSFAKPAPEIIDVMSAVIILISPPGVVPKDVGWKVAKSVMGAVAQFLTRLQEYDKENIDPANLKAAKKYTTTENFNGAFLKSKSSAAAGICEWARNVVIYNEIYQK